ncbi:MAG: hypothetical protein WBW81_01635, partial [Methylocella sp.]
MSGIISDVITPLGITAAGAAVGSVVTYLLSRRREKAERTPHLLFEFSDLPEHENLGAVGFRNLQSKLERLISGTIRNVGTALAIDIKLDIYHFRSSKAPPLHEISGIHVSEALQKGEALQWSKSIRLADLTIDGPNYKSGTIGVFSDDKCAKYYHFHVVFSCKNPLGEEFSTIYCMEKTVENNVFKGNKIVFIRQLEKYEPMAQFPAEWRD